MNDLARQAQLELARRAGYRSFEAFFRLFPPSRPYIYGRHTLALLRALNGVQHALESEKCRYLIVNVPPRHGKSDQASRRYPVWSLIRRPDWEIILVSYNYSLATEMSIDARRCFKEAAPVYGQGISDERSQVDSWRTTAGGAFYATGMGGTITGRGANQLIIDDYIRSREDAESELVRDGIWNSFQSDLMTRLAPVHSVVIVANRWHEDDLVGRIVKRNDKKDEKYDPDFPHFDIIKFPANVDGKWLFPERFTDKWYRTERAVMGSHAWNSQGQQEPRPRSGNMFRADLVQIKDEMPRWIQRWTRGWDLASTEKQRLKEDPDYTVGVKATIEDSTLYVADVQRGQWNATRRDDIMYRLAVEDGPTTVVKVEVVAGYKDTYTRAKAQLAGKANVKKFIPKGDKVARASYLEPLFEAKRVVLKRGYWNDAFLAEMASFPAGKHDDQVDALVVATHDLSAHKRQWERQVDYHLENA